MRDALKHGRLSLGEVLATDSEAIRKMPVRIQLASLPDIGKAGAQKLLDEMEIADSAAFRVWPFSSGIQQRERLLQRFASTEAGIRNCRNAPVRSLTDDRYFGTMTAELTVHRQSHAQRYRPCVPPAATAACLRRAPPRVGHSDGSVRVWSCCQQWWTCCSASRTAQEAAS
ncbi:hypothetical protein ACFWIJ_34700, partial [Streptomyces sp. NPDC127079]|uniref:hypothetical protein n=1 Tax=Streptomyces sp. NPDC127079 TaxID=3347132 RepID=UPI003661497A